MKKICIALGIVLCLLILIFAMVVSGTSTDTPTVTPLIVPADTGTVILPVTESGFVFDLALYLLTGTLIITGALVIFKPIRHIIKVLISLITTNRSTNNFRGALADGSQLKFPISV